MTLLLAEPIVDFGLYSCWPAPAVGLNAVSIHRSLFSMLERALPLLPFENIPLLEPPLVAPLAILARKLDGAALLVDAGALTIGADFAVVVDLTMVVSPLVLLLACVLEE